MCEYSLQTTDLLQRVQMHVSEQDCWHSTRFDANRNLPSKNLALYTILKVEVIRQHTGNDRSWGSVAPHTQRTSDYTIWDV